MIEISEYELMWKELRATLQETREYGNVIQSAVCNGVLGLIEEIETKYKNKND